MIFIDQSVFFIQKQLNDGTLIKAIMFKDPHRYIHIGSTGSASSGGNKSVSGDSSGANTL